MSTFRGGAVGALALIALVVGGASLWAAPPAKPARVAPVSEAEAENCDLLDLVVGTANGTEAALAAARQAAARAGGNAFHLLAITAEGQGRIAVTVEVLQCDFVNLDERKP